MGGLEEDSRAEVSSRGGGGGACALLLVFLRHCRHSTGSRDGCRERVVRSALGRVVRRSDAISREDEGVGQSRAISRK